MSGIVDFTFAWEGASGAKEPWRHLEVVKLRGTEAISTLYRYEIILFAREPAPEVDPDELVQFRGALRIATLTEPSSKVIHGVITEAEEIGPVPGGMLYRIVLMPPLVRAAHRRRCRIFLEKTTRQIIDSVLQGDPELRRADGATAPPDDGDDAAFAPAKELFAWRVLDGTRIDDVATRSYCVQYNESDLAFISRLLEEEGIGYHFENGTGVCLLVLSDKDQGRAQLDPFSPLGAEISGRAVSSMKLGKRLRPRKVSLVDYNWKKPALDMSVEAPEDRRGADLFDCEYPGGYPDAPQQGAPLATAMLERLEVEANYAVGEGTCRLLSAGSIFALEHTKPRYDGEYLVTKLEARGEQQGVLPPTAMVGGAGVPYVCTFECARRGKGAEVIESRFRPARVTPRPRIQGSQTAFVTAEPSTRGAEIHVGGPPGAEIGCVRVKFHWDRETERHTKEPTSCWVRVSQMFAGAGEGGVFHPRVGVEVIVDFEEGDPDRPIVVGRVYNGANRPPGGAPTFSTFKTMTSPGNGKYNELSFEDAAGKEQIRLHTPKDWNSEVGNDRTEAVTSNSKSDVGVNRTESTGANRTTTVGGNNTEAVTGNETVKVAGMQDVTISSGQKVLVTAFQTQDVIGPQTLTVTGVQTETVTGARATTIVGPDTETVTEAQTVTVHGAQDTTYKSPHTLTVTATQDIHVTGNQGIKSDAEQTLHGKTQKIIADTDQGLQSTNLTVNATSKAQVSTATLEIGAGETKVDGGKIIVTGGPITIMGGDITITGGKISVSGGSVGVSGGKVDVVGGMIKLN